MNRPVRQYRPMTLAQLANHMAGADESHRWRFAQDALDREADAAAVLVPRQHPCRPGDLRIRAIPSGRPDGIRPGEARS